MEYKNIYHQICIRGKTNRQLEYSENHHIIPKCMGGSDDPSNMTRLTAKEHYLAHKLLYKIHKDNPALHHAYAMMAVGSQRTYTSGQYSSMKEARSAAMKMDNPMHKEENRVAQAQRAKALWEKNNPMWQPEVKKVHSDRMKKDNPNKGGASNHTARSVRIHYIDGTTEDYKYMKEVSEVKGIPHDTVKYMFKHAKGSQKWGIEKVQYTG